MPLTKSEIARLRSLQDKRTREELGCFVVEGEKVLRELLAARFSFSEIYATPDWRGRSTRTITSDEMERISHYPTPSSVFAVGQIVRRELAPGALNRGITVALDAIQDPGNVGAVLRIADWFGCARVLLSPDSADLFSQKVINASMGSFARVEVHTVSLPDVLVDLTVPVFGCDLIGESVHRLPPMRDVVIVIGNEGRGISDPVADRLTRRITIPRFGLAESLNAAIATAVVCDNLRRG